MSGTTADRISVPVILRSTAWRWVIPAVSSRWSGRSLGTGSWTISGPRLSMAARICGM